MDIIKRNRNLVITVIVLVVINIITLFVLWLGRPNPSKMRGSERAIDENIRIQKMLKEELGFSTEQAEQFLALRKNHREETVKIDKELILLKKEMFEDAMYGKNEIISDSLLNLALKKQGELEKITFDHFLKLKRICTPEQQEKLFETVHKLIGPPQGRNPEGPPRGNIQKGPPPGKLREGPPPPPRRNK